MGGVFYDLLAQQFLSQATDSAKGKSLSFFDANQMFT